MAMRSKMSFKNYFMMDMALLKMPVLLQDIVDVDGIALLPPPLALLVASAHGFRLAGGLLGFLGCGVGGLLSVWVQRTISS